MSAPAQAEIRPCAQCATMFAARRDTQEFCSAKCRQAYHVDRGATGKVSGVRRLVRGVSLPLPLPSVSRCGPRAVVAARGDDK